MSELRNEVTLKKVMSARRVTVYFLPELYRALRAKAVTTGRSFSELVNEAARRALQEDAFDAAAFCRRAKEPSRAFSKVLHELKRAGFL